MRRTTLSWGAAAAIIIFCSSCSKTDSMKPPASDQPGRQPGAVGTGGAGADVRSDDDFVRDVALKNMAEIELSRLAVERATNGDIKSFAQRMIADHDAAGSKLKSVLSGQPIDLPFQLDDKHRETAGELAKKQGGDFDRGYLKAMIESHQDLAAKLESRLDVQSLTDWKTAAAGRTQDKSLPEPGTAMRDVQVRPDKSGHELTMRINQWAADTYPVAQKHLDAARALDNTTKNGSTN